MSVRAIVLAAGKGTRMKSARAKVLHEICGRPMLWFVMRALADAGVGDVVVVTSPENDAAVREGVDVRTVVQEPQRGTGHAVQIALGELAGAAGSIVVAYGDMPLVDAVTFADVISAQRSAEAALALTTARMPLPSNFGRVIRSGKGVERIVEARDCTPEELLIDEMNAGIYAFDEPKLRSVIGQLRDDNAQGELYLTDTIATLAASKERVVPVAARDHKLVLGINDRVELARARATLGERICEEHMRAGVTIVDPATTYLEPELQIAADVIIHPNTTIGGRTQIGTASTIGPNARVLASRIGAGVTIAESLVVDCVLGDRVIVGPFAHLRGGAKLEADVRIGNFVEVKNSELGPRVKSMHLAYLGDSEVGEGANIGAGTITCNYDGVRKNRTTIGKGAHIGSNSSLVAPVTIGEGAETGAGTVVIRDVPDGARVVGNPARILPAKISS